MIEFRWIAGIALWTLLIGPVLDMSSGSAKPQPGRAQAARAVRGR